MKSGQTKANGIKALYSADVPILVFGDGSIIYGDNNFTPSLNGAMDACICPLTAMLLILDGLGNVLRVNSKNESEIIAKANGGFGDLIIANEKRQIFAVSSSRNVYIYDAKTNQLVFEFIPPMAPITIAFDLAGENFIIGHGKGLTIYDLKTKEAPIDFPAMGGIIAASFSPDLRFLVAVTGEPSLVGWRLKDGKGFRMAGYPTKPNSLAWVQNGKSLVTSGGPVAVVWPFSGENGPMGMGADTFRTRTGLVSSVASSADIIALGYSDGGVDLAFLAKHDFRHLGGTPPNPKAEIDLRKGQSRVASIALSNNAKSACWVCEDGKWAIAKI